MPALDGLRGVAVVLVVVAHATSGVSHNPFANGGAGVDIFFVLSGFLITTLLLEERQETNRVRLGAFYARRARRLLPALFMLVLCYMLIAVATAHRVTHAAVASLFAVTYTSNFVLAAGHEALVAPLAHTWSLAQEEQFYLLWPIVLGLTLRRSRRFAIWMLVVWIVAATAEYAILETHGLSALRLRQAPDTRSLGLAIGCLAALLRFDGASVRRVTASCGTAISAVVIADAVLNPTFDPGRGGLTLMCCASAIVVVHSLDASTVTARILQVRPLRSLGRISYSLYLYHFPILIGFGAYLKGSAAQKVAAVAISCLAAALSTRFIEQPFRRRRPSSERNEAPSPAKAAGLGVARTEGVGI